MAGNRNMIDVDEKTHHLSLGFHFDPSYFGIPSAKQLRTFLLPCQEVWPSKEGTQKMPKNQTSFSNFRNLRVFDLHNSEIEKVPTCIQKMKYLRYLDLSRNDKIKALPNSISRLQLLQVLKLSNCEELRELPKDITKLVNLRHLDCERCWSLTHMPCGLGKLTSLQMLTWFPVAKDSSVSNHVGGLVELNRLNLRGRIEIRNLKCVKDESEFESANLMEKQLLQSLSLCWNRDDDDDDNDNVDVNYDERCLERLRPHENLKKLKVCDYGGTKFPDWLSSLTNLVNICIQDCGNCDRLPLLDRIPSLQYLRIDGFPKLEFIYHEGDNFPGAGGGGNESTFFPSLKELYILDCPHLKSWWKKGDDLTMKITAELPHFTRLSKLEISECSQLTCMPLFPNLDEKLLLENCRLVHHLQQMIKMAIVQAVPSTSSSSSSSSSMLGLSKLKVLWIVSIEDLEAFPEELLQNLSSLEELHLMDCPRLASLPLEMRRLPLRELDIRGCAQMKERYLRDQEDSSIVTASPLSKLKTLIVEDLESLPEDWLPNLTRLQQLCLVRCPKLQSLPRGMLHLTSLQNLDISQCTLHLKERCSNNKGVDWLNISHIPRIKIDGLQIQWQEQKAIEGEAAKMLSSEDILGVNTCPPGHSTRRTGVPAEKHSDPAKITTESNQLEGVPGYPQLDQKSYNDDQLAVLKYIYENNDNETLFEGDNCSLARSRIEDWKPRRWLENNVRYLI
uniref:R13L1/DRL21-like LRR repeat region domain-containing protein n=1 Tax=Manihot esculenta TaxID=3983 RepID=A0A2C9V565_MANES